jgi:hypothetical protein
VDAKPKKSWPVALLAPRMPSAHIAAHASLLPNTCVFGGQVTNP